MVQPSSVIIKKDCYLNVLISLSDHEVAWSFLSGCLLFVSKQHLVIQKTSDGFLKNLIFERDSINTEKFIYKNGFSSKKY